MRGESKRDDATVRELWRTSSTEARYRIKLADGPRHCRAWEPICRVLAVCYRIDPAMLAEAFYGSAEPFNRVAAKHLLAGLTTPRPTSTGRPRYDGRRYLRRVAHGWYAWPEDALGQSPASTDRLERLLRDRPRTHAEMSRVLGVCEDRTRCLLRALRRRGLVIHRAVVHRDPRPGRSWVGVYWIRDEEDPPCSTSPD